MKQIHHLSLAFAISLLGTSAWAAPNDQHTGHHPAGSAPASTSRQVPAIKGPSMEKMDIQIKAMRDMHEKMMTMMNGMPTGSMSSMKGDMAMHHQMMEKRMEMMGASMQMMLDRLPPVPAK